jgi:AAA+ superfamily predicted ATPase
VVWSWFRDETIDERLRRELGGLELASFAVHTRSLPGFRFVDLYRAAEAVAGRAPGVQVLDNESAEDLNNLFHGPAQQWGAPRTMKRAARTSWPVGPGEEATLPVDCFWIRRASDGNPPLVLRARHVPYLDKTIVEAAARQASVAERALEEVVRASLDQSIFRGRLLEIAFEQGTRDALADVEKPDSLRLLFKAEESVTDDDVVIDDECRVVLQRNVIDLHERRDLLKRHRVPVRRGVLLYGPPGTGKTYACRWVCSRLRGTTRLVVTGTALHQVTAIFNIARLYQPALVVLEDVDLVFASREINLYSSVLGELLDQMDGLRPHEDVGFLLTTNAIDRMEAAVRDRPGRISQCVHFAAPSAELRRRYLERYLRSYDASRLDLGALVDRSAGSTQAFLKEWVHRSVQIATERLRSPTDALELLTGDFQVALEEMRRFGDDAASRIIGFGASR